MNITKVLTYLIGFIPILLLLPTFLNWSYVFLLMILLSYKIKRQKNGIHSPIYNIIWSYIIYITIINIYGFFIAENYWEFKALITNICKYYSIIVVLWVSRYTNIYILYKKGFYIIFFSSIICAAITHSYSFIYAMPFSFTLYILFYGINLKNKKTIAIIATLFFCIMTYYNIQRIDIIKLFFIIIIFIIGKKTCANNLLLVKSFSILLIITPLIFLYTSTNNIFNPFKMNEYIKGEYSTTRVENGNEINEDFKADTRTGIYVDIFKTLEEHNNWITGRTPAKGYKCLFIETTDLYAGITERSSSEVGILNILLHYGIIGVVLYSCIIIYGIWLALYRSKNSYCKLLGLYMSFFFCISWIWQPPQISLFYIFDMCIIGLCYSPSFRGSTNKKIQQITRFYI